MLQESWGTQEHPVSGSMMASVVLSENELSALRDVVEQLNLPGITAISQVGGLLLVRHAGPESATCRFMFEKVWGCLRFHLNQRQTCTPRFSRT